MLLPVCSLVLLLHVVLHLQVACPIAYGSLAFLLERKKQSEFVTHRWTRECAMYLYLYLYP